MESIQVLSLCGIGTWVILSSIFNVTQKIRSLTQPWVSSYVVSTTPITLKIQVCALLLLSMMPLKVCGLYLLISFLQKYHNKYLDAFFSALSCVVSVPFYTAFLPLLFWVCLCFAICTCVSYNCKAIYLLL